jgi:hypothetical protein
VIGNLDAARFTERPQSPVEFAHWIGDQLSEDFEAWRLGDYAEGGNVLYCTRNGVTFRVSVELAEDNDCDLHGRELESLGLAYDGDE